MATINISEDDFQTVAIAAMGAKRSGDMEAAHALDKIARKINAALTASMPERRIAAYMTGALPKVSWRDMPSTIED